MEGEMTEAGPVHRPWRRIAVLMLTAAALVLPAAAQTTAPVGAPTTTIGPSGQPVPRFVSLKSDRVHARQGPGLDHKVLWVYRRAGLPLEVIREYESWRQVRDSDGAESWVVRSLVSDRRTALVMPWEAKKATPARVELLSDDREGASPVAIVEAGVIASIRSCDTRWCHVSVGDYRGYIQQSRLWGVYPDEPIR
jgi:SH3-like domain-containing protein